MIKLSKIEFENLLNYSCSFPTAFIVGKRWRRAKNYHDQDITNPDKWWIYEDFLKNGEPFCRQHKIKIMTENEVFIRDRLYE